MIKFMLSGEGIQIILIHGLIKKIKQNIHKIHNSSHKFSKMYLFVLEIYKIHNYIIFKIHNWY